MQKLVKKLKSNWLRYGVIIVLCLVLVNVVGILTVHGQGLVDNVTQGIENTAKGAANVTTSGGTSVAKWAGSSGLAAIYLLFGWIIQFVNMILGEILAVITAILLDVSSFNHFVDIVGIQDAWTVVRDLCNLFFVLALLLIAFGTILGLDSYNYKKLMIKFLMMALLINFSLTITGILIDFSQVVMLTFVNAYAHSGAMNIYNALQVGKLYTIDTALLAVKTITGDAQAQINLLSTVASLFVVTIFLGISCLTIGVMAITLIFRVVMLWLLAILSPLPYLLSLFPQGSNYGKKWWDMFTRYLIHGPILAFFLWLSLYIATQPGTFANFQSTSEVESLEASASVGPAVGITEAGQPATLMKFAIALGMLLGGLMITKEIGVIGGGLAGKIAAVGFIAYAAQKIVGASFGMAGLGARATLAAADNIGRTDRFGKFGQKVSLAGFKAYNIGRQALGLKEAEGGEYLKNAKKIITDDVGRDEGEGKKRRFARFAYMDGFLKHYTSTGRNALSFLPTRDTAVQRFQKVAAASEAYKEAQKKLAEYKTMQNNDAVLQRSNRGTIDVNYLTNNSDKLKDFLQESNFLTEDGTVDTTLTNRQITDAMDEYRLKLNKEQLEEDSRNKIIKDVDSNKGFFGLGFGKTGPEKLDWDYAHYVAQMTDPKLLAARKERQAEADKDVGTEEVPIDQLMPRLKAAYAKHDSAMVEALLKNAARNNNLEDLFVDAKINFTEMGFNDFAKRMALINGGMTEREVQTKRDKGEKISDMFDSSKDELPVNYTFELARKLSMLTRTTASNHLGNNMTFKGGRWQTIDDPVLQAKASAKSILAADGRPWLKGKAANFIDMVDGKGFLTEAGVIALTSSEEQFLADLAENHVKASFLERFVAAKEDILEKYKAMGLDKYTIDSATNKNVYMNKLYAFLMNESIKTRNKKEINFEDTVGSVLRNVREKKAKDKKLDEVVVTINKARKS